MNNYETIIDVVDSTIYLAKKSILSLINENGLHIDHPLAWSFKRKILEKVLKRCFFHKSINRQFQ